MAPTCPAISSVALAVWPASALTSEATTAKPLAGVAGARRLDRGVERQQVGLAGDGADQPKHVADLLAGCGEAPTIFVACPALTTAPSATPLEWVT